METREAQQIVRMVESHYQTDFGSDGRTVWLYELADYDAATATRAVAMLARNPLPANRARPQLSDFRAVYLKLAKDEAVANAKPALPVSPSRRPAWVERWERARAAGDARPFPEQAPGYEELRRASELDRVAYALPNTPHSEREVWVQPDEFVGDDEAGMDFVEDHFGAEQP